MATYTNSSNTLAWNELAIASVPEVAGVYCLRNADRDPIYIGSAGVGRLRARIREHFNDRSIPACYFDWYQCASEQDARALEARWVTQHQPAYNMVAVCR